jgi:Tfp pilus assembly protein PilF
VSRPYEIDCDRRAARAIGFRDTTAALAKIHAVHPIRNSGLLSLLVYATATHPSREIRLAALRATAPESDRPAIELSEARIRWQRRLTIAALAVWLTAVSGTIAAAILKPQLGWLPIPLWTVALTPLSLIILAQRKRRAVARQRMGSRPRWIIAVVIGGLVGVSLFLPHLSHEAIDPIPLFGIQLSIETSLLALACLVGVFVWFLWTNGRRKLRHAVVVAFQVHDFRRVLELGRQSPKVVSRDHILRYNIALARAICDDRPAAIAMLEGLWQEKPRFPLTAFILCQLLLDGNQPERALAIAQSVVARLPRDAGTHSLEARVRRRLGQLDEAQAACDRLLALEPEQGIGYGISAAIALDRGDLTRAQELIGQALAASPGEAYLQVIHAEIALQAEPLEAARAAVEQAFSAVRTNPLVFLQTDIARLEQKLWERDGSSPIFQAADPVA